MDNNKQMITAIVEYNYNAVEPDELNLRKGDILHSIKCSPGGWWEGTLGGRTGMFPDNFVRVISMGDPLNDQPVQMRDKPGRTKCRAVFSYTPNNEDELALGVGDIIEVLGEVEEGWWRGRKDNCVGVFPSNFVAPITGSSSPISGSRQRTKSLDSKGSAHSASSSKEDLTADAPSLPPKPVREQCRVLFPYDAQNEDELNLREGDIVTIITKEVLDKGWWRGELRGRTGVFPDNFVQIIPSDAALSPARDSSSIITKPVRITQSKSISKTTTFTNSSTTLSSSTTSLTTSVNSTTTITTSPATSNHRKDSFNSKQSSTTNATSPIPSATNSSSTTTGTVASQRKSLEMKIEAESEKSKTAAGAPPLPGKKPSVPAKKSPIASLAGGIFAGLKQKVKEVEQRLANDHTDGCVSSKISISPNNNNNASELPGEKNVRGVSLKSEDSSEFDQVERSALLQDPRALRPKAPGRRPPSQIATKEETTPGIMNGNSSDHHASADASIDPVIEEEIVKPKTREWEKHKAPWMEELKLNQAKKGGDKIIDKAASVDIDKKEDAKKDLNPLEMSKSMTSISSRIKIEASSSSDISSTRKESNDMTKSMTSIAKGGDSGKEDSPAKSSGLLRNRSISPISRPSNPLRPVTIASSDSVKPEKSETKVSPVVLRMNNINNARPTSLGADKLFDKASGDESGSTENKLLIELAEKISRLEATFERETKRFETAIEKLSNQLENETRERIAIQAELEKLTNCVTQV